MDQIQDIFSTTGEADPSQMVLALEKSQEAVVSLLRAEIALLEQNVASRFDEIAALTRRIETLQEVHRSYSMIRDDLERARRPNMLKRFTNVLFGRKRIALIAKSPLFDAVWYAERYADVHPKRAARHYMQQGSLKGYDPGPDFCTMDYYMASPDVAEQGIAALLHYEMFGRREERALQGLVALNHLTGKR